MCLLPQLNAVDAHCCLGQGHLSAGGAFCCAHGSRRLLTPWHPQNDLDLMIVLQGCSCSMMALMFLNDSLDRQEVIQPT